MVRNTAVPKLTTSKRLRHSVGPLVLSTAHSLFCGLTQPAPQLVWRDVALLSQHPFFFSGLARPVPGAVPKKKDRKWEDLTGVTCCDCHQLGSITAVIQLVIFVSKKKWRKKDLGRWNGIVAGCAVSAAVPVVFPFLAANTSVALPEGDNINANPSTLEGCVAIFGAPGKETPP